MDKEFKGCDKESLSILLVGDGDFSFAVAFLTRYTDIKLTATTLETDYAMLNKYPNFSHNLTFLRDKGIFSVDQERSTA